MIKILFICHGNICRSPMAEMIMRKLVHDAGLESVFDIDSAATSTEEIGNGIYPPARSVLAQHGVPIVAHSARRVTRGDMEYYDAVICMDRYNIRNLRGMFGNDFDKKIRLLRDTDVDDPWYTDRFDIAYDQILAGCRKILDTYIKTGDIK